MPTVYRCLTCGWRGKGSIARAGHWNRTQHPLIVPKDDERFTQTITHDENYDGPDDGEAWAGGFAENH